MTRNEDAEEVRRALKGVALCNRCQQDVPKDELRSDPRMENTFGRDKLCEKCFGEVCDIIRESTWPT